MGVRIRIRDRQIHQQLKHDLVEHLWSKFGRDEDNNWVRHVSFKLLGSFILLILVFLKYFMFKMFYFIMFYFNFILKKTKKK